MADRTPPAQFQTTVWDRVRAAATDPGALAELLEVYRPALVVHVCHRRRCPPDAAEDLVQDFLVAKVLGRDLIARADDRRGRFRTYLLTAFDRFVIDRRRAAASRKAAPDRALALEPGDGREPVAGPDRAAVFDVALALRLLGLAVTRFRDDCLRGGRPDLWGLFEGRVLAHLTGGEPADFAALAGRCCPAAGQLPPGRAAKWAMNAFVTARNRFRRLWRDLLGEVAGGAAEDENEALQEALAAAGPELLEELREQLWGQIPEVTLSAPAARLSPGALGDLMDLRAIPPRDLGAVLGQVLAAPVLFDAGDLTPALVSRLRALADGHGLLLKSFGDLFAHPAPGVELLEITKQFAKDNRSNPDSPLPAEVSTVLYYAALAAALVRHGERITRHGDEALRQGFGWVLAQPWVGEEVRALARAALDRLPR